LFIAVPLTDDVRAGLVAHLTDSAGDRPLPGKPVRPDNWHMTLRFLGQTDQLSYEKVLAALTEFEPERPFTVRFGGLGAFPRPARATVLWMAITTGADRLVRLAAVAEEVARRAGFAPEDRPFHPHLTLSRIRPHQDVRPLVERVPAFPATLAVDRVVVYRSHLGRGGAKYEQLERIDLLSGSS
jgi:2'-5' RNA ligase